MTNVHTFENSTKDTLGYIGTSEEYKAIVLVFRGTLPWDIKNWISDINFIVTDYPLCDNCKQNITQTAEFIEASTMPSWIFENKS